MGGGLSKDEYSTMLEAQWVEAWQNILLVLSVGEWPELETKSEKWVEEWSIQENGILLSHTPLCLAERLLLEPRALV